mmetsp:Transcript_23391/g.59046  ORF Transcript_23391/g.59046 Transcript_23391/m.59046 type:complete len:458 (-) Transcript_23391:21-1394(-)
MLLIGEVVLLLVVLLVVGVGAVQLVLLLLMLLLLIRVVVVLPLILKHLEGVRGLGVDLALGVQLHGGLLLLLLRHQQAPPGRRRLARRLPLGLDLRRRRSALASLTRVLGRLRLRRHSARLAAVRLGRHWLRLGLAVRGSWLLLLRLRLLRHRWLRRRLLLLGLLLLLRLLLLLLRRLLLRLLLLLLLGKLRRRRLHRLERRRLARLLLRLLVCLPHPLGLQRCLLADLGVVDIRMRVVHVVHRQPHVPVAPDAQARHDQLLAQLLAVVLEEQHLAVVRRQRDVLDAVKVDVDEQRGGVGAALVEGGPPRSSCAVAGLQNLQVVHERGHHDLLGAVAVKVGDERRGVHAGGDLRHPAERHVERALQHIRLLPRRAARILPRLALQELVAALVHVRVLRDRLAQLRAGCRQKRRHRHRHQQHCQPPARPSASATHCRPPLPVQVLSDRSPIRFYRAVV